MANQATTPTKILTANGLLSGRTLYWTGEGWDEDFEKALHATTPDAVAALEARGQTEEMVNMVVGAYLVALSGDETHTPVALRERHRKAGPSVALPGAATA